MCVCVSKRALSVLYFNSRYFIFTINSLAIFQSCGKIRRDDVLPAFRCRFSPIRLDKYKNTRVYEGFIAAGKKKGDTAAIARSDKSTIFIGRSDELPRGRIKKPSEKPTVPPPPPPSRSRDHPSRLNGNDVINTVLLAS